MNKIDYNFMQPLPPQAFFYDSLVKGLDGSFFKSYGSGTAVASGGIITINKENIASYVQFTYGTHRFLVDVVGAPTSGDSRTFGLFNPGGNAEGVYLQILGAVAKFHVTDSKGQGSDVTIDNGLFAPGTIQMFEIRWTPTNASLFIDGLFAASVDFSPSSPCVPMPLAWFVSNLNADNLKVKNISAFNCGRIN